MLVLKGDIVRTNSGVTGEVVETWGCARSWLRIKSESVKNTVIAMELDVEIIERPIKRKSPRERR